MPTSSTWPTWPRWYVPKECRLEWRQWGALHVVYNPASGNTHLLNGPPASILRSLETQPRSLDELKALVESLPERSHDSSDIDGLVAELDELGLIAPAPP